MALMLEANRYKSSPNYIGVRGYNFPINEVIIHREPRKADFVQYFNARGIDMFSTPLKLDSTYANEELETVAIGCLLFTFQLFKYDMRYLSDITLRLRKKMMIPGLIELLEAYFPVNKSINLTDISLVPDIKKVMIKLNHEYNIPTSASRSYVTGYLTSHGSIHAIQDITGRYDTFAPSANLYKYLDRDIEREAHNKGLFSVDAFFSELQSKTSDP